MLLDIWRRRSVIDPPTFIPPAGECHRWIHDQFAQPDPVFETHVHFHIERVVIETPEKIDLPPLPKGDYIFLDRFIQLRIDKGKQALWYWKKDEWKEAKISPLAKRTLSRLHQICGYEDFALRVMDIATALDATQESISREIKRINNLCDLLGIKRLLEQLVHDKRWYLNRRLDCCKQA